MIVYQFVYCSNVHESAYGTMSLHKTRKGAEMAMEHHKEEERKKFDSYLERWKEKYPDQKEYGLTFGEHEGWDVGEIELQE